MFVGPQTYEASYVKFVLHFDRSKCRITSCAYRGHTFFYKYEETAGSFLHFFVEKRKLLKK